MAMAGKFRAYDFLSHFLLVLEQVMNKTIKHVSVVKYFLSVFSLLIATGLSGCATPTIYKDQEKELSTDAESDKIFHPAIYHPHELVLNFPGYVIALEKTRVHDVATSDMAVTKAEVEAAKAVPQEWSTGLKFLSGNIGGQSKTHVITHVMKYYGLPYGESNCAVYSLYQTEPSVASPFRLCDERRKSKADSNQVYTGGWRALENLREQLKSDLAKQHPTHIIVLTMGWNTAQEEAIRNFNAIVTQLKIASAKKEENQPVPEFRPLFIGVTWASEWASDTFGFLYRLGSLANKATDADEVGFTWLGAVINNVIKPLADRPPVVVIGHSFGARASVTALCAGSLLKEPVSFNASSGRPIEMFIGLQGAFSVNRLIKDHDQELIGYTGRCKEQVNQIVLTSSRHDGAVKAGFWGDYAGQATTYKDLCATGTAGKLACLKALETGKLDQPDNSSISNASLVYVNADDLIKFNAYKTFSAHSDIYRYEQGVLLWEMIKRINK